MRELININVKRKGYGIYNNISTLYYFEFYHMAATMLDRFFSIAMSTKLLVLVQARRRSLLLHL